MRKSISAVFAALSVAAFLGAVSPSSAQPKSPPVVTGVAPTSILGLSKGSPQLITLTGSNFIYVTSAEMVRADAPAKVAATALPRPIPQVKASLTGDRTSTTLGLMLEAPFAAPDGLYFLRLWAGGEAFDVPLERLKVTVHWGRPFVLDCSPTKAAIGSIVTVRGRYFGDPAQPGKTQVLGWVWPLGQNAHKVPFELLSLSTTEAKVRIPDKAVYAPWDVVTPGGGVGIFAPVSFDPLYVRTLPPNLFQSDGTLGVLHFSESQFIFADGPLNSVFIPSSAMRGVGFREIFNFTFEPYKKYINLLIGSTNFRVRLNGTDRRNHATSLQSSSLKMVVEGAALKIEIQFESEGVEFVGEYETQDILSKKISWHKCLDINIDNLALTATLTPAFMTARDIQIQSVTVSSSFTPGFVVLDQNISVDQTPIKDFIKGEVEKSLRNYLQSEDFRGAFLSIFSTQVQLLFQGSPPINWIESGRADDGGMKLTGSTRPAR